MPRRTTSSSASAQRAESAAPQLRQLLFTWLLLLLLGAAEVAASFLPLSRAWRPLLMIPAVLMVLGVAVGFMEVRRGPALVRAFAVAAVLWLAILLGLGSVDPLTRSDYRSAPVQPLRSSD
jgi:cytochrome c oxidase subunit IV